MPHPTITSFTLGPFATNCYVVACAGECWIVDAGFEPGELVDDVRAGGLQPRAIILTHAHLDHIAGVDAVRRGLKDRADVPVWIHEAEKEWCTDATLNLSQAYGFPVTCRAPDALLTDGQTLMLGDSTWRVLHTPGHSPGGITLHHEPSAQALVGDTLFAGSVGRTDFPGASFEVLARSIRERLYTLDPRTRAYPGHGPATTIGREMMSNPFVRAKSRDVET